MIDVDDDTPENFTPDAGTGVNDGAAVITGSLDSDDDIANNAGADGLASLDFDIAPGTLLSNTNGNILSGGDEIRMYVQPDGSLLATTDVNDANATVFVATLDEIGASYEITFYKTIDDGAGTRIDNFSSAAAGNTPWKGVDSDLIDIADPTDPNPDSTDLLFTPFGAATINSDNDDIGTGAGQKVNPNEGLRIDLVNDLRRDAGQDETDAGGYLYDQHDDIGQFTFKMVDVQGNAAATTTVRITAYNVDDSNPISQSNVANAAINTAVDVDHASVLVKNASGTVMTLGTDYQVYDSGTSIYVSGIKEGWTITFSATSGKFEAALIENANGDLIPGGGGTTFGGAAFGLGGFAFSEVTVGSPVEFTLPVTLTDGDNDTSSGSITVTMTPDTPPIVLDLDGDGVELVGMEAGVAYDYDGDGAASLTAWAGADDGILARDANGDGKVSNASEFVFGNATTTDLEALASLDTDEDGTLDADDSAFAEFGVWRDANLNGLADEGEFTSLTALGIESISLTSDGVAYSAAAGAVSVKGTGQFTWSSGKTGLLADVGFATLPADRSNRVVEQAVGVAAIAGVLAETTPDMALVPSTGESESIMATQEARSFTNETVEKTAFDGIEFEAGVQGAGEADSGATVQAEGRNWAEVQADTTIGGNDTAESATDFGQQPDPSPAMDQSAFAFSDPAVAESALMDALLLFAAGNGSTGQPEAIGNAELAGLVSTVLAEAAMDSLADAFVGEQVDTPTDIPARTDGFIFAGLLDSEIQGGATHANIVPVSDNSDESSMALAVIG